MRFNIWKLEDGQPTKIIRSYESDVELGIETFSYECVAPFAVHIPETEAEQAAREAEENAYSARLAATNYLVATDWYVIRAMDSGVPVPDDVKQKRQDARSVL